MVSHFAHIWSSLLFYTAVGMGVVDYQALDAQPALFYQGLPREVSAQVSVLTINANIQWSFVDPLKPLW